jgi:hypothetical protein
LGSNVCLLGSIFGHSVPRGRRDVLVECKAASVAVAADLALSYAHRSKGTAQGEPQAAEGAPAAISAAGAPAVPASSPSLKSSAPPPKMAFLTPAANLVGLSEAPACPAPTVAVVKQPDDIGEFKMNTLGSLGASHEGGLRRKGTAAAATKQAAQAAALAHRKRNSIEAHFVPRRRERDRQPVELGSGRAGHAADDQAERAAAAGAAGGGPEGATEESEHSRKAHHGFGHNFHVHIPKIPHPQLHATHGEVLPVAVLLQHSPFHYVCQHTNQMGLLEKLASAFTTIRVGRGEVLPDSPFFLVAKGTVVARNVVSGRPITTKSAGSFINWSGEFTGFAGSVFRSLCFPLSRERSTDPHAMELVADSDCHVSVLTAKTLQRFMESSDRAGHLIRTVSDLDVGYIPLIGKAKLQEHQARAQAPRPRADAPSRAHAPPPPRHPATPPPRHPATPPPRHPATPPPQPRSSLSPTPDSHAR